MRNSGYIRKFGAAVPVLACLTAPMLLPAQEQRKEPELQLNMDAVKMIQFDFNGEKERPDAPRSAEVEKKWMKFKDGIAMPKSLLDTTKLWKPSDYIRFEPYTIWTKFGEDPIFDKLITEPLRKWEIKWTFNPDALKEEYGKRLAPSPGRMYQSVTGSAGAGTVIRNLDIMGFVYHNFTRRGRMLAHNRKHANAWKTYKDYKPTREDSLKVRNFYRRPAISVPDASADTDSVSLKLRPDTLVPRRDMKKPPLPEDGGNLYEYIRRKQAEDSVRRQKNPRKEEIRTNPYDVQRQIRRLREMSD